MAVISSGTVEYGAGAESASFVLPIPGPALPGDLLIATLHSTTYDASVSAPSGVTTLAAHSENPSANHRDGGVYLYTVPGSPPALLTWTWNAAMRGNITWALVRGMVAAGAAFAMSSWGTSSPVVAPAVTAAAGAEILAGVGLGSGSVTITPPSPWSTLQNALQRRGYMASKGVQASAGSTGTASFALSSGSSGQRAWQLALAPAGSGGSSASELAFIAGLPSHTQVRVTQRSSGAEQVRLKVATDAGMSTGVATGEWVSPDSTGGWARLVAPAVPDTAYWCVVEMDDGEEITTGPVHPLRRSAPTPGTPTSFSIAFGGDNHTTDGAGIAYTNLAAHDDDVAMFLSMGDTHAADNTGTSQSSHREDWESLLTSYPGFRTTVAGCPFGQSFGDHDGGGGNNAVPGAYTAPNIAAARQVLTYPNAPVTATSTAWALGWGRVRIIAPDWVHERTADEKISAAQMAWLEAQLNEPEPLKILLVGSVWYDVEPAEGWPDGDSWSDYADTRAEILDLIEASKDAGNTEELLGLHTDQHALAAMSGAGNDFGGFPVVGASPLSSWSSHKGGVTPDSGRWPTSEDVLVHQHGIVQITDTGEHLVVTFRGYDDTNTERVSLTFGTHGWVPPQPVTGTSTASLTTPTARWSKAPSRPLWWDPINEQWRAILATSSGHRLYTLDPETGATQGAVVENRQAARVTAAHHEGTTYVLRQHATSTLFSAFSSAWAATVTDVTVPLTPPEHDASPVALLRTSNGHLWAACQYGGQVRVTRSTDNGATWSAVTQFALAGTGIVVLLQAGTNLLMFATGNDGVGRAARRIPIASGTITAGLWTSETLPALPAGTTSDDHADGMVLPDGRALVVAKTTDPPSGAQPLLYSLTRSTSGTWTMDTIEPGPDEGARYTRPRVTLAGRTVRAVYGSIEAPRDLSARTTSLDLLGTWSTRTALFAGPDWSDGAAMPAPADIAAASTDLWPVLAHDRADSTIWLAWQPITETGTIPGFLGESPIEAMYLGSTPIAALYLGDTQLV